MRCFLTLDVGTTAVKAGLFDEELKILGLSICEYTLQTPQKDYVELPAETYWQTCVKAVRQLLSTAQTHGNRIVSVTCTTQGETLIPLGQAGIPLEKAIVWLDGRAKEEAEWISSLFPKEQIYRVTGQPEISAYTPVAKHLWLKRHRPDIYRSARSIVLLEDYLIFKLCGRIVTNPALMCTTGFFDLRKECLWEQMFEACGLEADKIPPILPCGTPVEKISLQAAAELGISDEAMVTTGAMDQVASAIGAGNVRRGIVTETTGTCQFAAATCGPDVLDAWSPVTVYSHAIPGCFLQTALCQTAGIIYKWFREEFCPDLSEEKDAFRKMDEIASEELPLARGVTLFPHFAGMQYPHLNESLRGAFIGIGLDATRGCFIRAILEGVGYMLRECIEDMYGDCTQIISLGGGAKSALWCQIKADICKRSVAVLSTEESTSVGAAILGAVAVGVFSSIEQAGSQIALKRVYEADPDTKEQYEQGYQVYRQMYEHFCGIFSQRTALQKERA